MSRLKLPHVSVQGELKVVESAEVLDRFVSIRIACAGCGEPRQIDAHTIGEAHTRLRQCVKGWRVIFDRDVNDGELPYCPACVKSIFPKLEARIRAERAGKRLPPHNPSAGAAS